jgi:hypothetical protein
MKKKLFTITLLCLVLLLAGCTGSQNEGQGGEQADTKVFEPIVGDWYSENGLLQFKIYENGGFAMKSLGGDFEGYLQYTEEANAEGISGPHFDLYLENNELYSDNACLIWDENRPGTLTFEQGMGAELLTHEYVEPEKIDWIYANFVSDLPYDIGEHNEFEAFDDPDSVEVLFTAIRDLKDFKFYNAFIKDVTASGQVSFGVNLMYEQDEFKGEVPLKVKMLFPGDSPNNALSYTDPLTGATRFYLIELSGYDGSIVMVELSTGQ